MRSLSRLFRARGTRPNPWDPEALRRDPTICNSLLNLVQYAWPPQAQSALDIRQLLGTGGQSRDTVYRRDQVLNESILRAYIPGRLEQMDEPWLAEQFRNLPTENCRSAFNAIRREAGRIVASWNPRDRTGPYGVEMRILFEEAEGIVLGNIGYGSVFKSAMMSGQEPSDADIGIMLSTLEEMISITDEPRENPWNYGEFLAASRGTVISPVVDGLLHGALDCSRLGYHFPVGSVDVERRRVLLVADTALRQWLPQKLREIRSDRFIAKTLEELPELTLTNTDFAIKTLAGFVVYPGQREIDAAVIMLINLQLEYQWNVACTALHLVPNHTGENLVVNLIEEVMSIE